MTTKTNVRRSKGLPSESLTKPVPEKDILRLPVAIGTGRHFSFKELK